MSIWKFWKDFVEGQYVFIEYCSKNVIFKSKRKTYGSKSFSLKGPGYFAYTLNGIKLLITWNKVIFF